MNSKSDEKFTNKPSTNARPSPTVLRLATSRELQPRPMESAETPRHAQAKQIFWSRWNDNDDDPGPTAA